MGAAIKPKRLVSFFLCFCLALTGCWHVGPKTIPQDRFDYGAAVAASWKNQTLLNIVKLRYLDLPVYLDVGQIVSSYTIQGSASVGGTLSSTDTLALGGSVVYQEHPTITYSPLTGPDFMRGLMTPIDPASIFFMIESGYRADTILEIAAESINGLKNRASNLKREADPKFVRVLELMGIIQDFGGSGIRTEKGPDGESTVFFFRNENIAPEVRDEIIELRNLLGIKPEQNKLRLVYSPVRGGDGELAIGTRSLLQIQLAMAQGVQVPQEDVDQKRVIPVLENTDSKKAGARNLLSVHCAKDKPQDAFTAIHYRDKWFWINDTDLVSKRTFAVVLLIFNLANTGPQQKPPVLTIGAN